MSEQGVFEFCQRPVVRPEADQRLFFGVLLGQPAARVVAQLADIFIAKHRLKGERIEEGRLHMSLHALGDSVVLSPDNIAAAIEIGNTISMSRFEVTLRYLLRFGQERSIRRRQSRLPLVLRGESLGFLDLRHSLWTVLSKTGLSVRQFSTPHVTLLFGSEPVPLQAIEPIRFFVSEFALIHSELGRTKYNVLHTWSLH